MCRRGFKGLYKAEQTNNLHQTPTSNHAVTQNHRDEHDGKITTMLNRWDSDKGKVCVL